LERLAELGRRLLLRSRARVATTYAVEAAWDAQAALEDAIRDEPDWAGVLSVEEIELDAWDVSANY